MQSQAKQQDFHGRLEVAVRTIIAPTEYGRSENQDNYLLIDAAGNARFLHDQQDAWQTVEGWPCGHVRLAILDGMGGHSQGRQATERSVAGILTIPATDHLDVFARQLEELHLRLHQEMHTAESEPGCTLTVLEIPPGGPALLFHVSDSRLYAVDDKKATCLTIDHVPATKFALRGMLDESEWRLQVHERSGYQISQAFVLGNTLSGEDLSGLELDEGLFELHDGNLPTFLQGRGDRRSLGLKPGQVYLLASDGLWHLSRPQSFIRRWPQILGRSGKAMSVLLDDLFVELILASNDDPAIRGDNTTAIAFRVLEPRADTQ